MPTESINPRDSLDNALKYWWIIALCMILGGLAGWLISLVQPPVLFLDVDPEVQADLNSFEQDQIILGSASIALSTPVLEQVTIQAGAEGIPMDVETLNEILTLERRLTNWTMSIRHQNPATAATLANLWIEETFESLQEAHAHALALETLRTYRTGLESCVASGAEEFEPADFCTGMDLAEIENELNETKAQIQIETVASQGLFPGLKYDLARTANPPQTPQRRGTNSLVLAGALIGFVVGAAAVGLWLGERLKS
jgi:hypothetical protein